jgi:hypothetical protein
VGVSFSKKAKNGLGNVQTGNSRLCQVAIPLAGLGGSPAAAQPPALACMEYLLHTQTTFTEAIEYYSFMLHALWE